MSRKDFELIARTLKDSKPIRPDGMTPDYKNFQSGKETTWDSVVTNMARALAGTNSRFNRERFLKACGYSD